MASILIIDDDSAMSGVLMQTIRSFGHEVAHAMDLHTGLRMASELHPDVTFLDVNLPDGSGLDAMAAVRSVPSEPEVIIFTGSGDPDAAELAIRGGAWDYIEKPASVSDLLLPLRRALEYRMERRLRQAPSALRREGIIGSSAKLTACLDQLARAASSDVNVLLTGETGTGKELFALAIHQNSKRASGNFVVVDCTALPETLVESILFGHERGAFTGADRPTEGLIRQANGGTLFLDEAGELPLIVQKTFLRALQEHRFRPLGSRTEVESDFRLIAATNRNLDRMVQNGEFRSDLLFRLRSFQLDLPPLRERPEDIRELVRYHVDRLCKRQGGITRGISPEFVEALESYDWPGNARELVQMLEQALAESQGETVLYPNHLPVALRVQRARTSLRKPEVHPPVLPDAAPPAAFPNFRNYRSAALEMAERQYMRDLMIRTNGDIQAACSCSGLSRPRLYALLSKTGVTRTPR
jgi:two-component system, NtrC family, response regulator